MSKPSFVVLVVFIEKSSKLRTHQGTVSKTLNVQEEGDKEKAATIVLITQHFLGA